MRRGRTGGAVAGAERRYRFAAVLALAVAVLALAVMCAAVRVHPWSVMGMMLALPAAVMAGWHVVSRRGLSRAVAGLVVLVAVVAPVLHVLAHRPVALVVTMALFGVSMACARYALRPVGPRPRHRRHRSGVPALPSGRAVLLLNPRSGGGRASGVPLRSMAPAEVDVVRVGPGEDLATLAEAAVTGGAGVLGVAGGDGSVAAVAAVAVRHGVPLVCVPAGTRNHFALDLGIDPRDVAHAVTAFRGGTDLRVDVAEVNGRVFVNNVSLGLYPALLASPHYRRSKVRAVLDQLPGVLGPDSAPLPLRFDAPDGTRYAGAHALLISNNAYRLGGLGQGAWRPLLTAGSLGVLSIRADSGRALARLAALELFGRGHLSAGYDRWTTGRLTVRADGPVTAAADGEPVTLEPLLQFTSRPGALLVRLPAGRPRSAARAVIQESRHLVDAALGRWRPPDRRRPWQRAAPELKLDRTSGH